MKSKIRRALKISYNNNHVAIMGRYYE